VKPKKTKKKQIVAQGSTIKKFPDLRMMLNGGDNRVNSLLVSGVTPYPLTSDDEVFNVSSILF
jgi:hypothetical protein